MPYALCPMPYIREHLMLLRKAISYCFPIWATATSTMGGLRRCQIKLTLKRFIQPH